jgi:hypothetical protein
MSHMPLPVNSQTFRAVSESAAAAGRSYGYPECCIAFFTEIWAPLRLSGLDPGSEAGLVLGGYLAKMVSAGLQDGRIPCPKCLHDALAKAEAVAS